MNKLPKISAADLLKVSQDVSNARVEALVHSFYHQIIAAAHDGQDHVRVNKEVMFGKIVPEVMKAIVKMDKFFPKIYSYPDNEDTKFYYFDWSKHGHTHSTIANYEQKINRAKEEIEKATRELNEGSPREKELKEKIEEATREMEDCTRRMNVHIPLLQYGNS